MKIDLPKLTRFLLVFVASFLAIYLAWYCWYGLDNWFGLLNGAVSTLVAAIDFNRYAVR